MLVKSRYIKGCVYNVREKIIEIKTSNIFSSKIAIFLFLKHDISRFYCFIHLKVYHSFTIISMECTRITHIVRLFY